MNLLERIEHWAAVAPNAIAHISGDRKLTYRELHLRSNGFATELVKRYGEGGDPIALLGHREPEMIIGFIGAAKAGRPYIPIDSVLPQERINHILTIAEPKSLLNPTEIASLSEPNDLAPSVSLQADQAFYIIFTSGSTGSPKGIVITRGSLEFFLGWMLLEHRFREPGEVFLNQAPFSFDLSVMDLYCSLATGGTLFSVGRDLIGNPKLLFRALAHSNVTTWISTPSFVELCLVERKFNHQLLSHVNRFLFCGETLLPGTATSLLDRFPNAQIWNLYGPTETTVATTSVMIDRQILQKYPVVPVGRPMPGTDIFLIDEGHDARVPPGTRGEIVIKGPNVSSGYLGQPDLTGARFLDVNGQRAYRTGDLGRFQDGLLFFEGRVDSQIKLNGYRIELGDLEANLRALPMVRDAAVLPVFKNGKAQWLAGFVVPREEFKSDGESLPTALREQLYHRLPAYMLPRRFVVLDHFPITANGKIDRLKLLESL